MPSPVTCEVVVEHGEDIEATLRRFKKLVLKSGMLGEVRRRMFYEKPSARRRSKEKRARQKRMKAEKRKAGMIETKPAYAVHPNGNGSHR